MRGNVFTCARGCRRISLGARLHESTVGKRAGELHLRRKAAKAGVMSAAQQIPTVKVSSAGAHRLRRLTPWVYRQDIVDAPDAIVPGSVVVVVDGQQNFVAQAFFATRSPLAL